MIGPKCEHRGRHTDLFQADKAAKSTDYRAKSNTATFLLPPLPSTSCVTSADKTFSLASLGPSMSGSPEKPFPTQTSSYSAYPVDFAAFNILITGAAVCGKINSKSPSLVTASRPRLGLSMGRTALEVPLALQDDPRVDGRDPVRAHD